MSEGPRTLDLRRELVFQLIETSRLLHIYVDERARKAGTTRAQWSVMGRLRRDEGITQAELASRLELQPISLVRLLDRLVEQGLVERRSDPSDRRAWRLYLTQAGRSMLTELDPIGHSIRAELLADLPDADMQQASDMLAQIKDRLKHLTRADHDHVRDASQDGAGEALRRSSKPRQKASLK